MSVFQALLTGRKTFALSTRLGRSITQYFGLIMVLSLPPLLWMGRPEVSSTVPDLSCIRESGKHQYAKGSRVVPQV